MTAQRHCALHIDFTKVGRDLKKKTVLSLVIEISNIACIVNLVAIYLHLLISQWTEYLYFKLKLSSDETRLAPSSLPCNEILNGSSSPCTVILLFYFKIRDTYAPPQKICFKQCIITGSIATVKKIVSVFEYTPPLYMSNQLWSFRFAFGHSVRIWSYYDARETLFFLNNCFCYGVIKN